MAAQYGGSMASIKLNADALGSWVNGNADKIKFSTNGVNEYDDDGNITNYGAIGSSFVMKDFVNLWAVNNLSLSSFGQTLIRADGGVKILPSREAETGATTSLFVKGDTTAIGDIVAGGELKGKTADITLSLTAGSVHSEGTLSSDGVANLYGGLYVKNGTNILMGVSDSSVLIHQPTTITGGLSVYGELSINGTPISGTSGTSGFTGSFLAMGNIRVNVSNGVITSAESLG